METEAYLAKIQQDAYDQGVAEVQTANAQASVFNSENEDNLIRWQLDLKEDMDRIYHLLKGDQIKYDEKGNLIYASPENEALKPFNEFGVQLIMNVMSFYLNRNTLLSDYDDATITWKVFDFGVEVSDLIFNKYEEMGMDNPEKIKMYPMIIRELVDTVHSAYLRARNGGERESLRTARTVTQTEPLASRGQPQITSKKRFNLLSPTSW